MGRNKKQGSVATLKERKKEKTSREKRGLQSIREKVERTLRFGGGTKRRGVRVDSRHGKKKAAVVQSAEGVNPRNKTRKLIRAKTSNQKHCT